MGFNATVRSLRDLKKMNQKKKTKKGDDINTFLANLFNLTGVKKLKGVLKEQYLGYCI